MTAARFILNSLLATTHREAMHAAADRALADVLEAYDLAYEQLEIAPSYEGLFPGITEDAERQLQMLDAEIIRACAFVRACEVSHE